MESQGVTDVAARQTWRDWWHGDVAVSQIGTTANRLIQLCTGLSRLQLT